MSQYPVTVWGARSYATDEPYANLDYGSYPMPNNIGIPNDSISSIKVAPFTKVTLYADYNYGGSNISIYGPKEIPDLSVYGGGFEDVTSSIIVTRMEPTIDVKMACCQGQTASYECGEYQPGTATCANVIAQYCDASHMGEAQCQAWCRQNPAQCDNVAVQYCNTNPSSPFCTCLKSPANVKGIVNPKCVDKQCLDTGYLTSAMQNTNCPSIVDCSVKTELANSGVILSNTIPVQQNCGNTTGVTPYTPTPSTSTNTTTTTTPPNTQPGTQPSTTQVIALFIQQNILIVLLFLICLFVAIIGLVFIATGGDE